MNGKAIVSVHDVMPSTLGRVQRILAVLSECEIPPATLLVVPGKGWQENDLSFLRSFADGGHTLAGHGWIHKATTEHRTLFHHLHARLISRNEAEHLSKPDHVLLDLISRCHAWFASVDLPEPELYVPPAWALGTLSKKDLATLPFRWYEVLRGFIDGRTAKTRWLPLAGFEADTTFRKVSLRLWNGLNQKLARRVNRPLRISIHPDDLDLLLNNDLKRMIGTPWNYVQEAEIAAAFPTMNPS